LDIKGTPYLVDESIGSQRLSDILKEDMGDVDLAACLYNIEQQIRHGLHFDVDGVYQGSDLWKSHRDYALWRVRQQLVKREIELEMESLRDADYGEFDVP